MFLDLPWSTQVHLSVWDPNGSLPLSRSLLFLRTIWIGRKANGPWSLETVGEGESRWLEMLNQEVSSRKLRQAQCLTQLSGGFLWGWEG